MVRPIPRGAAVPALALVVVLVLACAPSGATAASGTPTAPTARTSVAPASDTYVSAARPHRSFRRAGLLRVDGLPRQRSFLRFDVPRLRGRLVVRASVRLFALRGSRQGFAVRALRKGRWMRVARSGRVRGGRWTTFRVTRFVRAGRLRLALATRSRRGIVLASRERRRHAPRLVVDSRRAPAHAPAAPAVAPTAAPLPAPAAPAPVRVAAVGDVHPPSASATAAATAAEAAKADVILGLGDYQYPDGSLADFNAYFDRDWGPLVPKMYPVFGPTHDKDWQADQPLSYFNGAGAHGYRSPVALKPLTPYSFDRGAWHFIALPDACFRVSGCDPAPITDWLARDLGAHPQACTLAYWHQPYFASATTKHTAYDAVRPWVDLLYAHHVDVVLTGHQHAYERFGPQNPSRQADPNGLQAFVVGTGGIGMYPFTGATAPNSSVRQADTYGVLDLTLRDGAYDWRFAAVGGGRFGDAGSAACR